MTDRNVWKLVVECLEENVGIVLMIVAASQGSSPGRPGFKMAVSSDGRLAGSIGGGSVEYELVEQARSMLQSGDSRNVLRRCLHEVSDNPDSTGMTCSGEQSCILIPFSGEISRSLLDVIRNVADDGSGRLCVTPDSMSLSTDSSNEETFSLEVASECDWRYEESRDGSDTVYIIGGGHVCQALARVLVTLGFTVVVLDDRPEILDSNDYADHCVLSEFTEVANHVPEGDQTWIIIMTPSHRADEVVLQQFVNRAQRYLGMLGSKAKVKELYANLMAEGVEEAQLSRVHSPIGVPIHSHTPAEIAVSIAAELVSIRNS